MVVVGLKAKHKKVVVVIQKTKKEETKHKKIGSRTKRINQRKTVARYVQSQMDS